MPDLLPITIRPFTSADYEAIASVSSRVWHEFPLTADEIQFGDEKRNEKLRHDRFVVEADGGIVGVGEYGQSMGA